MKQLNYTQGPWRVGDAGMTVFGPPNGQPAPEVIANVRSKTNSKLIAVAPELLEALSNVADMLDMVRATKTERWDNEKINMTSAYLLQARQVIAKVLS